MASLDMQPADKKETEELAKVCQDVAERSSRILGDFVAEVTGADSGSTRHT